MREERGESCALYLRLSREDERGAESASIENQRKILREYAARQQFYVYDEYVDDGYTGLHMERPALRRLLRDVERGRIQIVLTKDLSRLGRNSGRLSLLLDEYFPKHHIRYISVSEGIDTAAQRAADSLLVPMQNLINELYAGDISRKIHAALEAKMREGAYIGAFAPYGYRKDPQNKNHLLADAEAGAVVREMFRLAREGQTPAQIAAILNERGVLTPSLYRLRKNPQLVAADFRGAREWKAANISKMLRNEVYLGHTMQGKRYKPGFKSEVCCMRAREDWRVVRDTHEALVDEETWQTVRRRMRGRTEKRERGFVNLFSGLAFCADCGKAMSTVGTRRREDIANLNCGGYKQGGTRCCSNHTIAYDTLYEAVLLALREQLSLTEKQKEWLLWEIAVRTEGQEREERRRTEGKAALLEQKLERLLDDKYAGCITQEQFEGLYARYTAEKEEAEREQREWAQRAEEAASKRADARRLLAAYEDLRELREELLFGLIRRIEVRQGEYLAGVKYQEIQIYFAFCCEPKTIEMRRGFSE